MFEPNILIPVGITIINLTLLGYMMMHPGMAKRIADLTSQQITSRKGELKWEKR